MRRVVRNLSLFPRAGQKSRTQTTIFQDDEGGQRGWGAQFGCLRCFHFARTFAVSSYMTKVRLSNPKSSCALRLVVIERTEHLLTKEP